MTPHGANDELDANGQMQAIFFQMHRESKQKLHYFLLASAGAGIGFAIAVTEKFSLGWPGCLLIISVLTWGCSFWCGIICLRLMSYSLKIHLDRYRKATESSADKDTAVADLDKELRPVHTHHNRYQLAQLYLLLAGAIVLLAWRVASAHPEFVLFGSNSGL